MTTADHADKWLRSNPGPISAPSPQLVLREALARCQQTTPEPLDLGEFIDHLWNRGIVPEQAGMHFHLKIPGVAREYTERRDTPTRIN